jgi:hypothetical protein
MLLLLLPQVHPRLLDGQRIRDTPHLGPVQRKVLYCDHMESKSVRLTSVRICLRGSNADSELMWGRESRRECHGSRNSPRSESEAMGIHEMFMGSVVLM